MKDATGRMSSPFIFSTPLMYSSSIHTASSVSAVTRTVDSGHGTVTPEATVYKVEAATGAVSKVNEGKPVLEGKLTVKSESSELLADPGHVLICISTTAEITGAGVEKEKVWSTIQGMPLNSVLRQASSIQIGTPVCATLPPTVRVSMQNLSA